MLIVKKVRCENKENPIGIELGMVSISWQLDSDRRNVLQAAYHIQVALDDSFEVILLDTGKVESEQCLCIPLEKLQLEPVTRYYYRVSVWDQYGESSAWSDLAYWETGLQVEAGWVADWIAAPQEQTQVMSFEKDIAVHKPIRQARLYISSLGVYEASLNGERVGDSYFTPGWTSYDRHLQYQTYDVTQQLGHNNRLHVLIGNGWYKGRLTVRSGRNNYGGRRALIAQLHIRYIDGTEEVIVTDESWTVAESPILMSEIYDGEVYDARLEQQVHRSSACVEVIDHAKHILTAQVNEPIRVTKRLKPVTITKLPNHEWLIDMGQNMVGWVRFTVRHAYAGAHIVLQHAEILDSNGVFYTGNLRKAKQQIVYIAKGVEEETYEPHFTYQGFRYVKVSGLFQPPKFEDFEGVVLHSDMPVASAFETSNRLLNQLHHNVEWSQRGNFFDVPTDCPQRDDRLGWTGDAQVFIGTGAHLMDVNLFFAKWFKDVRLEQHENGAVPVTIPDIFSKWEDFDWDTSAGWGDAVVIIPWVHYLHYGDKSILKQNYHSMKRYIDYIREQGDNEYIWDTGYHLGDWLALDAKPDTYDGSTDKSFIATAYYAYSTSLLQRIAVILGEVEDAQYYSSLHGHILQALQDEFITPNGRLASDTQTAHVLVLMFNLAGERVRERAVKRLVELLKQEKDHLTTGFLGTPYLNLVLSQWGHHELACKLLFQEDYPSWFYPIKKGATTIWEHWDGIKEDGSLWNDSMNSYNHYAYGSIIEWVYRYVVGLEIDEAQPAYKHFYLQPNFGYGLDWLRVKRETAYGEIVIEWKLEDGMVELTVSIPANTTATLRIDNQIWEPVEEYETTLGSGTHRLQYRHLDDRI